MSPPSELEDALRRAVNMVKAMRVQKRYVDYGRYWRRTADSSGGSSGWT